MTSTKSINEVYLFIRCFFLSKKTTFTHPKVLPIQENKKNGANTTSIGKLATGKMRDL